VLTILGVFEHPDNSVRPVNSVQPHRELRSKYVRRRPLYWLAAMCARPLIYMAVVLFHVSRAMSFPRVAQGAGSVVLEPLTSVPQTQGCLGDKAEAPPPNQQQRDHRHEPHSTNAS